LGDQTEISWDYKRPPCVVKVGDVFVRVGDNREVAYPTLEEAQAACMRDMTNKTR
jgi:hypothetical protein